MTISIMKVFYVGEMLLKQQRNARRLRATLRVVSPKRQESLTQLREEVTKQAKPFADQLSESARLEKVTDRAPGVPGLFSDPQLSGLSFSCGRCRTFCSK